VNADSEVVESCMILEWHLGLETIDGSSDYAAASGTLVFPPGSTQQSIPIGIVGDTSAEPDETFSVTLTYPTFDAVIADGVGRGMIVNDDAAPPPTPGPPPEPPPHPPTPKPSPPPAPPPPSPIPGPPVGLTSTVVGTSVVLAWTPPVSGASPSGYLIDVGSRPGATDLLVYPTGNQLLSIVATNVRPGIYFVRVRAGNAVGESLLSNEVVVIVSEGGGPAPGPSAPPAAPIDLRAASDGSTVALVWSPPLGGGVPSYYIIEAGSSPALSDLANFSTGTPIPSFQTAGVPGGTYYVRVRAGNSIGLSAPSNEAVLVVGSLPP
jgi:hypothetical protein